MEATDLRELVEFSPDEVVRKTVFESERIWGQVLCLDRTQTFGPASDRDADAILTVVAGEAVFLVNRRRKRLKQWGSVLVPAGSEMVVTNASPEPLVILMVAAPPPTPRAVSG